MRNPPVHWTEGMFLRPHHFQAADRFWNELLGQQVALDNAFGYGLARASVSPDALANGTLEISGLVARWRDGTVVAEEPGHVDRTELKGRLNGASLSEPVTAYLAIPVVQEGQANVAVGQSPRLERHAEFRREADDESAGGNRQELAFKQTNCQVRFSTEELQGYDVIPLVRLVQSNLDPGKLMIDNSYFPPVLNLQAWPDLAGIVRAIHDVIGSRIQSLGEVIRQKGITLSSQSQGDLEKLLLLHALNESSGELSSLAFSAGVHPFAAFVALCRIVGRCSLFGGEMMIEAVPKYDHENLAPIFRWALERIRKLIYSVKEDEYEQRYFIGSGRGMTVNLEPEWFGLEWDWYFGVDPVNLSRDECFQLLKQSIDWKLGSVDMVEKYMTDRSPGVKLGAVQQIPRALPSRGNWVYFQIKREGEAWKHVQITQSMAMRVKTEQIANLDSLEGARRIRLSIDNQTYGLEFAVFAVRKRI